VHTATLRKLTRCAKPAAARSTTPGACCEDSPPHDEPSMLRMLSSPQRSRRTNDVQCSRSIVLSITARTTGGSPHIPSLAANDHVNERLTKAFPGKSTSFVGGHRKLGPRGVAAQTALGSPQMPRLPRSRRDGASLVGQHRYNPVASLSHRGFRSGRRWPNW
jgi:hypothetical protein